MVRSRPALNLSRATAKKEDLSKLSSEVLQLRLQALNLPITGSKAQLAARLATALFGNPSNAVARGKTLSPTAKKAIPRRRRSSSNAVRARATSNNPVQTAPNRDIEDSAQSDEDSSSSIGELFDHPATPVENPDGSTPLSLAQRAAIEQIVAETVSNAFEAFRTPERPESSPQATLRPRIPGMASPLGLSRPVDRNLEDRILRENLAESSPPYASTSTSPQDAGAATVATRTSAAAVSPATMLPHPAHSNLPVAPAPLGPPPLANAAKNKVEQLRSSRKPRVSTPIDIDKLETELANHPNRTFVSNQLSMLREGARIGYSGPRFPRVSPNLISAVQHPEVVTLNLNKEVNLGRVAGPYSFPPLPALQCHPVGVVPKKHSSDWRTIYHLSYPQGDSINDHIPKDPFSLSYVRVDDAISIIQSLGKGAFMAKTDLKSAFRLIPVHPDDWNLLGIYWQSRYFVDMYLPFGLRSSPFLFNQLSDSIEWILKHNYGLHHVIHILDDFFIAEPSKVLCLESFSTLLRVFMSLNAPVVASKTIGPSQVLEFMGIVLDSVRMEARLPDDKLTRIRDLLASFKKRRSARLVELQSLVGTLQFACKVVVPGRTFLQRIINLTSGVPSRFHHIRLNREFFKDINMWKVFLTDWNGRSFFLDSSSTPTPDLELYTDAASSVGFGGFLQGHWFQGRWPPHLRLDRVRGISIEWQELFPIVVACAIWHPFFTGKRLQFWCDNESVVSIINSGHSKSPRIMDLVRFLVLISMKHNFLVRARHVPGVSNGIADALSRFQMQRFRALAPVADQMPCTIPPSLMTL